MDEQPNRISVRVTPGAKKNSIAALKEGIWQIKVAAPPVEGKANQELIDYLSDVLGLRKSAISVLKGQTSRLKIISVAGLSSAEIESRLGSKLKDGATRPLF
jgi:uncharacterized protein